MYQLTISTEALQALYIVPGPVPLKDRPIEDLTQDEAQELIRQMKKVGNHIVEVRHTLTIYQRDATGKIKQEGGPIKREAEEQAGFTQDKPWSIDGDADDEVEVVEPSVASRPERQTDDTASCENPVVIDDDEDEVEGEVEEDEAEVVPQESARKRLRGSDGRFIRKT